MIEFLGIKDVGVISEAQVELSTGLTVLTGETGAGKTMVLSALNLLLGGKTSSTLATSDLTQVQGSWQLPADHDVLDKVLEAGGRVDDGQLILTRTVPVGGRSRCVAGGVSVPVSYFTDWAEDLVSVHGQSDQALLRKPGRQREVLDQFGGDELATIRSQYETLFARTLAADAALQEALTGRQARAQEADSLLAGLQRIEKVNPQPDEDGELADRAKRLENLDHLFESATASQHLLSNDDDSAASVSANAWQAAKHLEFAAELDPDLAAIAARLREIVVLAQEVGSDLSGYVSNLDAHPDELASIQGRRADLTALKGLYGPELTDVITWSQKAAARLVELEQADDIEGLTQARDVARSTLAAAGDQLHQLRRSAGDSVSSLVSAELNGLAMPDARFVVDVQRLPSTAGDLTISDVGFGPHGCDVVELLISAHRGAAAAPLARSASGGELSRVMLALEVVLADSASASTFVFDEVDAGVGGKAAVEIGRRLARLAANAQVLVVTHLPQVAAFADQHLVVRKESDGHVTRSGVIQLDDQQRVKELARMLAGQDESSHAAAHAIELLDLAALERTGVADVRERGVRSASAKR